MMLRKTPTNEEWETRFICVFHLTKISFMCECNFDVRTLPWKLH